MSLLLKCLFLVFGSSAFLPLAASSIANTATLLSSSPTTTVTSSSSFSSSKNINRKSLSPHWINVHEWADVHSSDSRLSSTNSTKSSLPSCELLHGLSETQIKICSLFHDHMGAVAYGAKIGLKECRYQFRHHNWNCSLTDTGEWGDWIQTGSKETSFAQAVWSAALTQSVARSCRDGNLLSCGCGKTPRPGDLKEEWRWGGCADNLQYGYKFTQNFLDTNEVIDKKRDKAKQLVDFHNNEAGRRSVLRKTKIACKCHGVSGSCALVTCWHQISSFREIGEELKTRYLQATQVKLNRKGRLQVKKRGVRTPSVYDLVFLNTSPDYCVRNDTLGIHGTRGRQCNSTKSAPDSCRNLCCKRGHKVITKKKDYRCNCKFLWCCQVKCQECHSTSSVEICN